MKRFVLIGKSLRHSASPALFGRWFRHHNIEADYQAMEIDEHEIGRALKDIETGTLAGANVTFPYKESVFQQLARLDDAARAIGAVNALARGNGGVRGLNTDAPALAESLRHLLGPGAEPLAAACVFGSGGAARAAIYALLRKGMGAIRLVSRNPAAAKKLRAMGHSIALFPWHQAAAAAKGAALLVNATPLGQIGFPPFPALPLEQTGSGAAFDLVYNPPQTAFMKMAEGAGYKTANGFPMLVEQAALSFEAWFGFKPETAGLTFEALTHAGERKRA
ncbi:MAG TPA: shikimate dehydrogenase [Sphingomonadales bacterium]|nr:shikimate dehydrogenase [Sphingomonadales bacterium]